MSMFVVPEMARFRFTLSQTAVRAENAISGARSGGEEIVKALEATSPGSRKITAGIVEPGAEEIRETISVAQRIRPDLVIVRGYGLTYPAAFYEEAFIYERRRPVATPNVRNNAGKEPETAPAATGG